MDASALRFGPHTSPIARPSARAVAGAAPSTPASPADAVSVGQSAPASSSTAPRTAARVFNPLLYTGYEAQRTGVKTYCNALSAGLSLQMAVANMWGFAAPAATTFTTSMLSATREMSDRMARDYTKPSFGLAETNIGGRLVGVKEEVVADKTFGSLLHFKRDTDRRDPKLLIVAPMSGHHATLLRDTVAGMLPNHDVYITDWKDARDIPTSKGDFGLDDYIDYVKDFIKTVGPDTHVMAVCQPTVPTLAAVALLAEEKSDCQPLSMTLMGGPLDTAAAPTEVTKFANSRSIDWFARNVIGEVPGKYEGGGRLVYPGFVQLTSFMAMNPEKHVRSHVDMFNHLMQGHKAEADKLKSFYDEYLAVSDLPARFYLDTVQKVFMDRELARGVLAHRGHTVHPEAIRNTALFTVEGEKDDISAPGQTTAAQGICRNLRPDQRFHYLQKGVGHYGLFSGHHWHDEIAPRVTAFIRDAEQRRGHELSEPTARIAPSSYRP